MSALTLIYTPRSKTLLNIFTSTESADITYKSNYWEIKSILEDNGNEIIEIHDCKTRHGTMMNGKIGENENQL